MDLWWKIGGYTRIQMTSADPERSLRNLSAKFRLENLERISDLELRFSVRRRDTREVLSCILHNGDTGWVVEESAGIQLLQKWKREPVLAGMLVLLAVASFWLSGRILFIRIEGNSRVSTEMILDAADACGVSFGVSRSALRSEQVKNRILETIPQLSWVGVNTAGCVATISVRERRPEPAEEGSAYGNIVAICDGVVSQIIPSSGEVLCRVGQAVKAGQVLISGYTDLGICTRVVSAQGEIYGLTSHEIQAVIPDKTCIRGQESGTQTRYSIILGKKRINFYANSGILDTTCGKMRMVYQLRLPGGWELPVCFIIEEWVSTDLEHTERSDRECKVLLQQEALRYLNRHMVAGQVLRTEQELDATDGRCILSCTFACRELIGKRSGAVYLEGD